MTRGLIITAALAGFILGGLAGGVTTLLGTYAQAPAETPRTTYRCCETGSDFTVCWDQESYECVRPEAK